MDLPKRRELEIRRIAYALYRQASVRGIWEDLVHDLTMEIDCMRYQAWWMGKGISAIECQAFKLVAKRWLSLPKPSARGNAHQSMNYFSQKPHPLDFQLREGFTMLKGETMDTELKDCRKPEVWISMDPWEKDLVRENY